MYKTIFLNKVTEEDILLEILNLKEETSNITKNYPPVNLSQLLDEDKWLLEIVVAGFKKEEIEIVLTNGLTELSVLEVSTKKIKPSEPLNEINKKFFQRKICQKNFLLKIPFNKGIKNTEVQLEDGILKIELSFKAFNQDRKKIEFTTKG